VIDKVYSFGVDSVRVHLSNNLDLVLVIHD